MSRIGELVAPNVSCIPVFSPFRYPGGKSRLYPFVRNWLVSQSARPALLVEPFAGGAHVGLAAAIEGWVDQVSLVELDDDIASVWETILGDDCRWLMDQIAAFTLQPEAVSRVLCVQEVSRREKAFRVLVRNRVSRGGITAPGAGYLTLGENGMGMGSRWYPKTLISRIASINHAKSRIHFERGDGLRTLRVTVDWVKAVYFIDPPYPHAGRRLYQHSAVDPVEVFELACMLKGDFLLTYNCTSEILALVQKYGLQMARIVMSTTHHRRKHELLIGRDLSWLAA